MDFLVKLSKLYLYNKIKVCKMMITVRKIKDPQFLEFTNLMA